MKSKVESIQRLKSVGIVGRRGYIMWIPVEAIKDLNINLKDIEFDSNEDFGEGEEHDLKSLNNLRYTSIVDVYLSWWFICDSFHIVVDKKMVGNIEEEISHDSNLTILLEYVDSPMVEVSISCDVNSCQNISVNEDFVEINIIGEKITC